MAEVTGLRNVALPYPVYGVPYGMVFPFLDADGDLVSAASTPDAEISKNGDTFADCTNESTEIATNSGMWYLLLTGTEMTCDVAAIIAKSAQAGMKTTPMVLHPRKLVTAHSGTVAANAGDGTTFQLASGASAIDNYYAGCIAVVTIDSVVEARMIGSYVGSTKVATLMGPAFNTAADSNDTYVVYFPEGRHLVDANLTHVAGTAQTAGDLVALLNTIDDFLDTEIAAILAAVDTEIGTLLTRLGTPSDLGGGASVAANLVDIEGQTDDIGAAGAGLTAIPWNAAWDAEVQSEVDDALKALFLDKLVSASGTADSGSTTTMVDAARTEGDADYWKGQIILFTSGNIAGQSAIITDFNAGTDTFTFAPATTQAVAAQNYIILPNVSVWDDVLAEHLTSGSTGAALNAAGAAGDPWSTALPGAYGAGTAGKIVGDNLNATVSSRATQTSVDTIDDFLDTEIAAILAAVDTEVAAILADTNELQTDWTDGGRLDLIIDAIKLKTDNLPSDPADQSLIIAATDAIMAAVGVVDDFLDTEIAAILSAVDTEIAAIKTVTDALTSAAAAKLALTMLASPTGTVDNTGFAPTITQFEASDITEATNDHYLGRIILFTSGAMLGQASDITDYTLTGGRGHFTVTALTEAPPNGVTFILI